MTRVPRGYSANNLAAVSGGNELQAGDDRSHHRIS